MGGSAWCRFASDNRRSMIAQFVACPIFIYAAFALGILVTSASSNVLGEAYWQPFLLLRQIQSHYSNSAGSRAAVFFASAALALAQVTVNMILNSVAAAMCVRLWAVFQSLFLWCLRIEVLLTTSHGLAGTWQVIAQSGLRSDDAATLLPAWAYVPTLGK